MGPFLGSQGHFLGAQNSLGKFKAAFGGFGADLEKNGNFWRGLKAGFGAVLGMVLGLFFGVVLGLFWGGLRAVLGPFYG